MKQAVMRVRKLSTSELLRISKRGAEMKTAVRHAGIVNVHKFNGGILSSLLN